MQVPTPHGAVIHARLNAQECDGLGIKIHYYRTIKGFIEQYSTKIDFITYDWINEKFSDDSLEDIILDNLNGRQSSRVVSWYSSKTGNSCTGFFKANNVYRYSQDGLSIYEMVDNTLVVNIVLVVRLKLNLKFIKTNALDTQCTTIDIPE